MANESPQWTVEEVLERIPELGIPHFQRGMVWGDDLKAALLESLYYSTPCGSFVLWRTDNPEALGVPIDSAAGGKMKLLVIDGQQRIRSLRSIFGEVDEGRVWCMNLAALPEFNREPSADKRQRPLFVLIQDPELLDPGKPVPPGARNVLPIRLVEKHGTISDPVFDHYRNRKLLNIDEALLEQAYPNLHAKIAKLRSGTFFVSVQEGGSLRDMVGLYNRINSAGRRVEAEERAFARLVGLQENTYENLRKTFEIVHPERAEVEPNGRKTKGKLDRDEVMKREREQAFGFKLFIRVFMQVAQYHLGYPKGRTEFSFEIADREAFMVAFGALEPPQSDALWGVTYKVLGYVREVLDQTLYCDDLRFLPDANSLLPAFQLLIHYSGLMEDERYRPLIAVLIQRLILAELDKKTILELIAIAGDHRTVAPRSIARMLDVLARRLSVRQVNEKLQQARSLQHRYVLMLYWLERSRGARDLSYKNLQTFKRKPGEEIEIDRRAEAQKQHMIPFSLAQQLYPEATRAGSHLVNSIGNLTYISADLNGWLDGLGDLVADLALENHSGRRAHFFEASPSDSRFLEDYQMLRSQFASNEPSTLSITERREQFERMAARRRELILAGLLDWISDCEREACDAFGLDNSLRGLASLAGADDRVKPTRPKFPGPGAIDPSHLIRELKYPSEAEDHLIELLSRGARPIPKGKREPWKDGEPPYRLQLTKLKNIWVKIGRTEVWMRFDRSVPVAVRKQVCELLGVDPSGERHVPLTPVPNFAPLLEALPEIEKQLVGEANPS